MQTQYKLLYRYMNETTNTAITNEAEYNKTEEFYTKEHKFNVDATYLNNTYKNDSLWYQDSLSDSSITAASQADILNKEADNDREQIITENMANQEKSNLLFAYDGTKRIYHQKYIPAVLGYKVRDWTRVPENQRPSGPDDFTKHFVMLGGYKLGVDDAYLVCKPQYIDVYQTKKYKGSTKCFVCISTDDLNNTGYKENSKFYHKESGVYIENINKIIDEETFFEWYDIDNPDIVPKYGEQYLTSPAQTADSVPYDNPKSIIKSYEKGYSSSSIATRYYHLFWNNTAGKHYVPPMSGSYWVTGTTSQSYGTTIRGWDIQALANDGWTHYGNYVMCSKANIIRDVIPEHYEDTGNNPYIIKDTYKPIPLSPWMIHSAHHSLESALASAKTLVAMVGINNVKLIKYVPLDQFIKIK